MARIADFDAPPVIETVLGAQFDMIAGLQSAHLGAFWKSLGADWPSVRDAPALPQEFEKFGEAARMARGFRMELSSDLGVRLMIRNRERDHLIQVQNGRLHVNWIKLDGREYPQYPTVRTEFDRTWERFVDYLTREFGSVLKPNQWEVTYVNAVQRGTVWQSVAGLSDAFTFVGQQIDACCGPLEAASAELHFLIPPERGRLHVHLTQRNDQFGNLVAQMTLTARGPIGDGGMSSIGEGLDLGRESIVRAFAALTTDEARMFWKERNVAHHGK